MDRERGRTMLYAVRYTHNFQNPAEELAYQRKLAEELLRWSLREEYSLELSSLSRNRNEHGKPYFIDAPVHFSLSHCSGLIGCGLSLFPLGIDGEGRRPVGKRLVRRVCTQEEQEWVALQEDWEGAFLSLWTLKESVMKLSGQGMSYGFHRASFTFRSGEPVSQDPDIQISQFQLPGGWILSAASRQEKFPQVKLIEEGRLF